MNTDVPTDRGGIAKGAGLYKDKEVEKRVGGKIFNLSVPNFKALSMSLSSVADFLWGEGECIAQVRWEGAHYYHSLSFYK